MNMHKILIPLFFLFNTVLFSQTSYKIKAGLNLSKAVYLSQNSENLIKPVRKLKPGFVAGFLIHHKLNKILSVQAEILYSQKGLKTKQEPHNKTINTMNYVEIPLSGHYSLFQNSFSSFDVYIGGYAAYWTDGKYKKTDLSTSETTKIKVDFNSSEYKYSRIDYGILSGLVYHFGAADFFARYTHSMSGSSSENTDAISNKVFSVGISYLVF